MGISEQETLARQLWVLFHEAIGDKDIFKPLADNEREAWIQVAQFVISSDEERLIKRYENAPMIATIASNIEQLATDDNPIIYVRVDRDTVIRKEFDDYPDHK